MDLLKISINSIIAKNSLWLAGGNASVVHFFRWYIIFSKKDGAYMKKYLKTINDNHNLNMHENGKNLCVIFVFSF